MMMMLRVLHHRVKVKVKPPHDLKMPPTLLTEGTCEEENKRWKVVSSQDENNSLTSYSSQS
jgi:hypothetical protein